jgi:hypothetical protein
MNTCSSCKYAIPVYYPIYRSFDLDFCSVLCRNKFLNIISIKDPDFKCPQHWSYYLNINPISVMEKEESFIDLQSFNHVLKRQKFNVKDFKNTPDININGETHININSNNTTVINRERNCQKIYKYVYISPIIVITLLYINLVVYVHLSI